MACFVVAYDLNQMGQNYDCIIGKLRSLPYMHTQKSVWFVEYAGNAGQLRDLLMGCLDANDRLFVSEVSPTWAGFNMPTSEAWLNDRGY